MATSITAPIATATPSIAHLATDPLRNFKFNVNIMHPHIGGFASMGFMTVSGLNITTEVIPYREGGMNAQSLDSLVLTPSGWKRMGDIEVGNKVVDPYGQESKVEGVYPKGTRPVYRITLADGSTTKACHQHLWEIETISHKTKKVVDTLALKNLVDNDSKGVRVPRISPIEFESVEDPKIDPYLLGVFLSEGCLTCGDARFAQATTNVDMLDYITSKLPEGHSLNYLGSNQWRISSDGKRGENLVLNELKRLGLLGKSCYNKAVPEEAKYASTEYRTWLLRGLLDGDGTIDDKRGRIKYSSACKQLRDDVRFLVGTLGGRSTATEFDRSIYKDHYAVEYIVSSIQMGINPFHMSSKANKFRPKDNAEQRKVVSVEYIEDAEVQCIKVSADSHLYITDDLIPTHNTTTQKLPGQSDFAPITLSQGMAVGSGPMWTWMQELFTVMQGTGTGPAGQDFRATVDVMVLDHPVTTQQVPVKAIYRVYNAWPTSIAFSDFDAGANAVLMQQISLAHEGFNMKLAPTIGLSGVSF